jgi:hypothetical protein
MLVVETVARVRRAYFVQEKSIKEIDGPPLSGPGGMLVEGRCLRYG